MSTTQAHPDTPRQHVHDDDPLYTCAEAGDYLNTGERYIRYLVNERLIAFHKVGGRYVRIRRSDLDAYLAAGRVEPRRVG